MRTMKPSTRAFPVETRPAADGGRAIGSLIQEARSLKDADLERIATYQRERGVRFGEAAVALRLADRNDVLEALSRQFQYTAGFSGTESDRELVAAADPFSDQADAFRELRSRLLFEVPGDVPRRALAVVSPEVGDGKTYLAANLAVTFSQLGARTLLIDADLRTPRLHRLLRVRPRAGLSSALAGFGAAAELVSPVPGVPNLHLLPAGAVPPNPLELLQRQPFGALMHEMLQQFEHVVVDTPAATRGADSRAVAARCGATIVVARRDRSRLEALQGLLRALSRGPSRIAGVVMNAH